MIVNKEQCFSISSFQKEKDLFYLLLQIMDSKKAILSSDLEHYIIGQGDPKYPIWIWSKNKISNYEELLEDLGHYIIKGEYQITCKKELYEIIKNHYKTSDYFEMGFLTCSKLIKPSLKKEIFVKINYTDKVVLAEYWREFKKEVDHESIPQKEALEEVEAWLDKDTFYVLKDSKGDILSLVGYSILGEYAKLSHVYTPLEYRRKGYCQRAVYELTKILLSKGLKPVLYTNYHYYPSNHAYQKVGYQNKGVLINFKIMI